MTAPTLSPWQVQLDGLTIGAGTMYEFVALDGFDELAAVRSGDVARPVSHGDFAGDDWAAGRSFKMTVEVSSGAGPGTAFDAAVAALRAVLTPTPGQTTVPLWFRLPGLPVLRADVKVRRRRIEVDSGFEHGVAVADVELRSAEPFLYGESVVVTTTFAQMLGGLEFDLFTDGTADAGQLEFGDPGTVTGIVATSNTGTAPAWSSFVVVGPTPHEGFDLVDSATGSRLRYTGQVPSGSTLTINSATGLVTLDGVDRRTSLVIREWFSVAPGATSSVLFSPLGGPTSALLTVTTPPTFW